MFTHHAWEEIAKQIEEETDPHKVAELSQKLTEAMIDEEREKVRHRLGIHLSDDAKFGAR